MGIGKHQGVLVKQSRICYTKGVKDAIIIQPVAKLVHATPQELIPLTSRACYASFDKQDEASDARLLKHFVNNDESPLEFAWAVMDITCSYATHVHLLRHRFFSFQWRSQRYDDTMEFILPDGLNHEDGAEAYSIAEFVYDECRKQGAKKQDARYVVPQGVAVQGFMAGTARAWLHFLRLRTSKKAMPETRKVAQQIQDELHKVWPEVV